MQNTNTGSISSHPSSRVFCPPHAPITTSLHRLSTVNQCMVMVRDLGHWQPCLSRETVKRTEAWEGLLMEGYRVGRGEELSMVLAVVKAVMHMGHCDLRLFLSLDLSALLSTASAPSLAFCWPCRLCLDTVCLSSCVCVCVWVTAQVWDHRRGSLGEVCKVNQGDLLAVTQRTAR